MTTKSTARDAPTEARTKFKLKSGDGLPTPETPEGCDKWIENGQWYAATTVDPEMFGQHTYDGGGYGLGHRDCPCGCYMLSAASGGPVNPFGACPANPKIAQPAASDASEHQWQASEMVPGAFATRVAARTGLPSERLWKIVIDRSTRNTRWAIIPKDSSEVSRWFDGFDLLAAHMNEKKFIPVQPTGSAEPPEPPNASPEPQKCAACEGCGSHLDVDEPDNCRICEICKGTGQRRVDEDNNNAFLRAALQEHGIPEEEAVFIEQGLADVAAGRVKPDAEVRPRTIFDAGFSKPTDHSAEQGVEASLCVCGHTETQHHDGECLAPHCHCSAFMHRSEYIVHGDVPTAPSSPTTSADEPFRAFSRWVDEMLAPSAPTPYESFCGGWAARVAQAVPAIGNHELEAEIARLRQQLSVQRGLAEDAQAALRRREVDLEYLRSEVTQAVPEMSVEKACEILNREKHDNASDWMVQPGHSGIAFSYYAGPHGSLGTYLAGFVAIACAREYEQLAMKGEVK